MEYCRVNKNELIFDVVFKFFGLLFCLMKFFKIFELIMLLMYMFMVKIKVGIKR